MNDSLKIAIAVHGRFHAFDLTRALLQRGHDVTLFTNYPVFVAERFGVPGDRVRSYLTHGVVERTVQRGRKILGTPYPEAFTHQMFGRWLARNVSQESWDVVHCWSGVSEELLEVFADRPGQTVLKRGSSHIRVQNRLLREEEERAGTSVDRPSPWMIEREEREYDMVNHVAVLSTFAERSFLDEGIQLSKIETHTLGVEAETFRLEREVIEERCRRIESGEPLRVLYVGMLAYRKGMLDAIEVARKMNDENVQFRFVGPVSREFSERMDFLKQFAEHVPNQPQSQLPGWYAKGDIFLFPTVEDGFAAVLTQAQAAGLPLLATTNCSGPDLIEDGENGWVLPIRSPDEFVERLRWCNEHRDRLADMVRHTYHTYQAPRWNDAAAEFEEVCTAALSSAANEAT